MNTVTLIMEQSASIALSAELRAPENGLSLIEPLMEFSSAAFLSDKLKFVSEETLKGEYL